MRRFYRVFTDTALLLLSVACVAPCQVATPTRPAPRDVSISLGDLLTSIRAKAKTLENSAGMRLAFQDFISAHHLSPDAIRYSDFVLVRLLFEATRDAGFWNVHWQITNQPPNSDNIWKQWAAASRVSLSRPTAIAECDELSALYAFLVEREGVKSVGLFWPSSNHTVAVWMVKPAQRETIRVIVPTSQIYLGENDRFDTHKFDPWRQKTIYEYTRRDVPDLFALPKALADFFLKQIDAYGGASDVTLQRLRYVRDAVLFGSWTTEQAARDALQRREALPADAIADATALQTFAEDMRLEAFRR
jgi:hypothetical protein